MISSNYKFIFIHNPKCGGTTIRNYIRPYCNWRSVPKRLENLKEVRLFHHSHPKKVKKVLEEYTEEKFSDYTVFTTVRNPWDRMVSWWAYGHWSKNLMPWWEDDRTKNEDGSHKWWPGKDDSFRKTEVSFDYWIKKIEEQYNLFVFNAENFLYNDSKLLIDKIIRMEDFNSKLFPFLKKITSGFGPSEPTPLKFNKSKRDEYRSYYTSSTKEIVEKKFEKDIEIGRYIF